MRTIENEIGSKVSTRTQKYCVQNYIFLVRVWGWEGVYKSKQFTSLHTLIVQELCESRGGRPNEPSGFRGRKAILNHASVLVIACP